MIFKKNYIYILMICITESLAETCIPFFKDQNIDDNEFLIFPERAWRYNSRAGVFDKLEYIKSNRSALCSVDFSSDLKGKVLNVGVAQLNSYLIFNETENKVTGFFGDIWTTLEEALKFSSIYRPSSDYSILKTGKVDALLITSLLKYQPTAYYAHSTVIGKNSYSLFALSEGTFVSKWWYIRIFDVKVWIISTLFVIIITLTILVIHHLKKEFCNETESNVEFGFPTFNLICVLGATSGQGFQDLPKTWSLRLCAITALHMGMLLSCGFNSSLTSYLAFRAPYVTMNNLDDVWKLGKHSVCVRNESLAYNELTGNTGAHRREKKNMVTKEKWEKLLNKNCPNMEDMMALRNNLCKPGFVYVETSDVFLNQYQYVQDKCQIVKIPGTYWSSKISFLHYRGSKYRKTIDTYLLRLKSTGVLKYLEAKWSFKQHFQQQVFSNFQEVELDHVQLLFIGFVIMIVLSVILCVLENLWFNFHNNPKDTLPTIPNKKQIDISMKKAWMMNLCKLKFKHSRRRIPKPKIKPYSLSVLYY